VGGILSILENDTTGRIVPPSDSRALANCLLEMLAEPERTRKMGVAGQNQVEDRFTVTRMVDDMLSLYGDVISAERRVVAPIPISSMSSISSVSAAKE